MQPGRERQRIQRNWPYPFLFSSSFYSDVTDTQLKLYSIRTSHIRCEMITTIRLNICHRIEITKKGKKKMFFVPVMGSFSNVLLKKASKMYMDVDF